MSNERSDKEDGAVAGKSKKLSGVQAANREIIGIGLADLHLSHKPPIARSKEANWYECMERQLMQVIDMCDKFGCPLFIAGDFFDKPINPPELLNFIIAILKKVRVFGIPGQHDLENHSYLNIHKTSYWNLVEAGAIIDLQPGRSVKFHEHFETWHVIGVPWGYEIELIKPRDEVKYLALVHAYIWMKGHSYLGAPTSHRLKKFLPKLKGFTTAIFGDNHSPFARGIAGRPPFIYNCGTFMRRKIDERQYRPRMGIIEVDGTVTPFDLDCGDDQFINVENLEELANSALDVAEVVKLLAQSKLGKKLIDFKDELYKFCEVNGVSSAIESLIKELVSDD